MARNLVAIELVLDSVVPLPNKVKQQSFRSSFCFSVVCRRLLSFGNRIDPTAKNQAAR